MILDFFYFVAKIKKIPRRGWIEKTDIIQPESVADHTFSMAIMAMILSDMNNLNSEKILKMALLHDLAESITGDITPDSMTKVEKNNKESTAMKKILKNLPDRLIHDYQKIWTEFQENKSTEAQFVHQIDKLEMALQAKIYSQESVAKENFETFVNSASENITNPDIKKILTMILDQDT